MNPSNSTTPEYYAKIRRNLEIARKQQAGINRILQRYTTTHPEPNYSENEVENNIQENIINPNPEVNNSSLNFIFNNSEPTQGGKKNKRAYHGRNHKSRKTTSKKQYRRKTLRKKN